MQKKTGTETSLTIVDARVPADLRSSLMEALYCCIPKGVAFRSTSCTSKELVIGCKGRQWVLDARFKMRQLKHDCVT